MTAGGRNLYVLLRYYFYTCRKKAKWVSQTWAEGRRSLSIPSPARVPPRDTEPRKRSWFAPPSKEWLRVNASNEGNARRLIKICSAPAAEDPLARHCLNASSA